MFSLSALLGNGGFGMQNPIARPVSNPIQFGGGRFGGFGANPPMQTFNPQPAPLTPQPVNGGQPPMQTFNPSSQPMPVGQPQQQPWGGSPPLQNFNPQQMAAQPNGTPTGTPMGMPMMPNRFALPASGYGAPQYTSLSALRGSLF